jgi:competence protein ComEA
MTAAACVRLSSFSGGQVNIYPADRAQVASSAKPSAEGTATQSEGEKININLADSETLSLLPGIGEVLAGRIVEYREKNGDFTDISEIMYVNGIGQSTFDKLKDYITVEGVP